MTPELFERYYDKKGRLISAIGLTKPHSKYNLSEKEYNGYMGEFPSGQRGQTVNLLAMPSVVRIHLRPFKMLVDKTF